MEVGVRCFAPSKHIQLPNASRKESKHIENKVLGLETCQYLWDGSDSTVLHNRTSLDHVTYSQRDDRSKGDGSNVDKLLWLTTSNPKDVSVIAYL